MACNHRIKGRNVTWPELRKAGAVAGIDPRTIAAYVNQSSKPRPETVVRIHEALTRIDRRDLVRPSP